MTCLNEMLDESISISSVTPEFYLEFYVILLSVYAKKKEQKINNMQDFAITEIANLIN